MKAAYFGAGILIPFVTSRVLLAEGASIPLSELERIVPLLIFLLGLGALVFDGTALRKQNVPLTQLPTIYGLRTSIGYLSFAGGLAAIQPLLALVNYRGRSGP